MLRVVYYARVSTEEEQQIAALERQCEENELFIRGKPDWIYTDSYIDEGKSGTTMDGRNDFLRLIQDMEKDVFDIIVIKQIDRGWRNLFDWKIFESKLIQCKKRLFIRLKNQYYDIEDDSSYISTTMDSMFAEWFSRNLSKKMNNAQKLRMQKGSSVITSGNMWGYNQVNGELVINEDEAIIVRLIFNLYIQGYGFKSIFCELDRQGIHSRSGTPFSMTTLKRMIKNEKYMGTLVCGKKHFNFFTKKSDNIPAQEWHIHENRIPPIISKDIWYCANRLLQTKTKKATHDSNIGYANNIYSFTSKIVCTSCGATYSHNFYTGKNKQRHAIWQCGAFKLYGRKSEYGCPDSITLHDDELTTLIQVVLFNHFGGFNKAINNLLPILDYAMEQTDQYIVLLKKLEKEIFQRQSQKGVLIQLASVDGITIEELKERTLMLSDEIEKIQTRKDETLLLINRTNNKDVRIKEILTFLHLENKPKLVCDEMIHALLRKIEVSPSGQIDVYLFDGSIIENVTRLYPGIMYIRNRKKYSP